MAFPSGKTIEEIGIDTTRMFRVVSGSNFSHGDIIVYKSAAGMYSANFRRLSDGLIETKDIANLEYYDDPSEAIPLTTITKNIMTNVLEFFRSMTATADEKLLKELGIEDPIGTPTETGLKLSNEIQYKENRTKVIEVAKAMKEAQEKK